MPEEWRLRCGQRRDSEVNQSPAAHGLGSGTQTTAAEQKGSTGSVSTGLRELLHNPPEASVPLGALHHQEHPWAPVTAASFISRRCGDVPGWGTVPCSALPAAHHRPQFAQQLSHSAPARPPGGPRPSFSCQTSPSL